MFVYSMYVVVFQSKLEQYLSMLKLIIMKNAKDYKGGKDLFTLTPGNVVYSFLSIEHTKNSSFRSRTFNK